jgi:ribosomal protein L37AE/L43A
LCLFADKRSLYNHNVTSVGMGQTDMAEMKKFYKVTNLEEEETTSEKCLECRRTIHELENLGVKFANCETCKDTIIRIGPTTLHRTSD